MPGLFSRECLSSGKLECLDTRFQDIHCLRLVGFLFQLYFLLPGRAIIYKGLSGNSTHPQHVPEPDGYHHHEVTGIETESKLAQPAHWDREQGAPSLATVLSPHASSLKAL